MLVRSFVQVPYNRSVITSRAARPDARVIKQKALRRIHFRLQAKETENETKPTLEEQKEDELVQRLASLKEDSQKQPATGFWTGVAEEASLIDWPPLGQALLQTVLVIAIVAVASLMLFALNAGLTDLSKWFYSV